MPRASERSKSSAGLVSKKVIVAADLDRAVPGIGHFNGHEGSIGVDRDRVARRDNLSPESSE